MAKMYVATLHTGNTLTIHGQTFFKGHPKVVTDDVLVKYLKDHPNFKVDERIVTGNEDFNTAAAATVEAVRNEMKASGEYVAPAPFEDNAADTEAPVQEATAGAKTAVRKGAVSAPRVTAGTKATVSAH